MLAASVGLGALSCGTTSAAATAKGQFYAIDSPRFHVITDGDPKDGRQLVEDLERFHAVMLAKTTAEDHEAAPPLRIFLAKSAKSFKAWTGPARNRLGLFVATGRGNFAIVDAERLRDGPGEPGGRAVLFHEYTHYIMAASGARVPSWYNEGFAEYMATTAFRDDGSYTLGCPAHRAGYAGMIGWLPMAKILEADDVETLMSNGAGGFRTSKQPIDSYAQSWYAVHLLNSQRPLQQQLNTYLQLWASGVSSEDAVTRAFGVGYAQFDTLVHQYALRTLLSCLAIRPARPLATAEVRMRPMEQSEVYHALGDLNLALFGASDTAFELLRNAATLAPKDAGVLTTLARAHLENADRTGQNSQNELERAQHMVDEAMRIAPEDPRALTLAGLLHARRAEQLRKEHGAFGDELGKARSAFRKAIRHDETIAEAYAGLGFTYLVEDTGSKEALVVLESAAYLLPLATEIAIAVARVHLQRNEPLAAIPALEYAGRWSHNPKLREAARDEIAKLRASSNAPPEPSTTPASAAPGESAPAETR